MRFAWLYIKQIVLIYFHTVSGPFTTRKWPLLMQNRPTFWS